MKSFFKKIADGFRKTRESWPRDPAGPPAAPGDRRRLYDDLEAVLLRGDVGPAATAELIRRLKKKVAAEVIEDATGLRRALREIVEEILRGGSSEAGPSESRGGRILEAPVSRQSVLSPADASPASGEPKVVLIAGVKRRRQDNLPGQAGPPRQAEGRPA